MHAFSPTQIDSLLNAALLRAPAAWPWLGDAEAGEAVLTRARVHGVAALIHERHAGLDWPPPVLEVLREEAQSAAMWELAHHHVVSQLLEAFEARGVPALVFKGTALAHSIYQAPALRSRGDTDLLIASTHRSEALAVLREQGCVRETAAGGEVASTQASYRREAFGMGHIFDVHWRINNSPVLARLFTFDELFAEARPLPALAPSAREPSHVHSLLIACMHRASHRANPYHVDEEAHHDPNRFIWLADIDLLARRLSAAEWDRAIQLARAKGMLFMVRDGLHAASAVWRTPLPPSVQGALVKASPRERAWRYTAASRWRQQWMDFVAVRGLRGKAVYLREVMFPPADYMRAKYPGDTASLARLYLRRALTGTLRRLAS